MSSTGAIVYFVRCDNFLFDNLSGYAMMYGVGLVQTVALFRVRRWPVGSRHRRTRSCASGEDYRGKR